ncbi:MAG: hypothetical protein JST48_02455 [Bacteroidetes bacterium]|nr:hypothetical protein [Bacteroidota bacterium]
MKRLQLLICLLLACSLAFSQSKDKKLKSKKLNKDEASTLTQDQRFVHEENRKNKNGKKSLSSAKKLKIQRKQARAAKHTRAPKKASLPKPKD